METLIDVIIPLYNSEKYISNLLTNLEKQTLKKFRAIFVDDGSKDNTLEELNKQLSTVSFAHKVLQQENQGAASARNYGLRESNAEWTVFVDSDDSLLPEYLECLYASVVEAKADCGICRFEMVQESINCWEKTVGERDAKVLSAGECMALHYAEWIAPVCMIINRKLFDNQDLFFDEQCKYCEDIPFITKVIEASERCVYLNHVLYLYWTHPGSLSRSPKLQKFVSGIEGFQRMEEQMKKSSSEAAQVFKKMGCARYYIGTLRKAAVQMNYHEFAELNQIVDFAKYKFQLCNMPLKQRIAGCLLLISKRLFYYAVKLAFKD